MEEDLKLTSIQTLAQLLTEVKEKNPLVHQITNYVTVNDCANIVLALGGSPVMADDEAEVEEMVSIASALVINIGTLNARTIKSMLLAGKKANTLGIPVILDPVGVGATSLRTSTIEKIISEIQLAILRGNRSEIKTIAGFNTKTRGVDNVDDSLDADAIGGAQLAKSLANKLQCTVAITGKQDFISNGVRSGVIDNGHQILSKVTGTGCMATALVGCYAGVTGDNFLAAAAGIVTMGLAGENAWTECVSSSGIGSFKVALFDSIYKMTPEDLIMGGKFHEA
jgi:hydroxyethylthiazole kinase